MKKLKLIILGIVGLCVLLFAVILIIPTAEPSNAPAVAVEISATIAPRDKLQAAFEILGFTFSPSDPINELPTIKGVSPDGFAQLYLVGDSSATYIIDLLNLSDEEIELRNLDVGILF